MRFPTTMFSSRVGFGIIYRLYNDKNKWLHKLLKLTALKFKFLLSYDVFLANNITRCESRQGKLTMFIITFIIIKKQKNK